MMKILGHVRHADIPVSYVLRLEDVLLRQRFVHHELVELRGRNDQLLLLVRTMHFEVLHRLFAEIESDEQPAEKPQRARLPVVAREFDHRKSTRFGVLFHIFVQLLKVCACARFLAAYAAG